MNAPAMMDLVLPRGQQLTCHLFIGEPHTTLATVAHAQNPNDPLAYLELRDVPTPVAPAGWVRVKVKASSLNMHVVWTLRGVGRDPKNIPIILGCDVAGVTDDGREPIIYPVIAGTTSDTSLQADLGRIFYQQLRVLGSTGSTRHEMVAMLRMLATTGLRPCIDRALSLERIHEGFAAMMAGKHKARSSSPSHELTTLCHNWGCRAPGGRLPPWVANGLP